VGGFAAQVSHLLAHAGLFDSGLKFRPLTLPDRFIDQDKPDAQYAQAGLKSPNIVATALAALGRERESAAARA
jgi:1-deoxy-D-xylulose-5-phosphate synthase